MGVQPSIGGAIGLAGRAARRLWALNSKGRQAYIATSLLTMGPIGFHSTAGLTSRYSPALLATLCAINAKLGAWTFYASACSGSIEVKEENCI